MRGMCPGRRNRTRRARPRVSGFGKNLTWAGLLLFRGRPQVLAETRFLRSAAMEGSVQPEGTLMTTPEPNTVAKATGPVDEGIVAPSTSALDKTKRKLPKVKKRGERQKEKRRESRRVVRTTGTSKSNLEFLAQSGGNTRVVITTGTSKSNLEFLVRPGGRHEGSQNDWYLEIQPRTSGSSSTQTRYISL